MLSLINKKIFNPVNNKPYNNTMHSESQKRISPTGRILISTAIRTIL